MTKPDPHSVWLLVDAVAVLFARSYMLARTRAISHVSPMARMLGLRDHAHSEAALLERELAVFRSHRRHPPPGRRPHYAPEELSEILLIGRLRGWSSKDLADRFIVHPNTIRGWRRTLNRRHHAQRLIGEPPWNKLHAAVRGLVHEIRRLCPEREFGTRTIARHIIRAGIRISRTSVRRILEEEPPKRRSLAARAGPPEEINPASDQLLRPAEPNRVWHADLTEIRVLWARFQIMAVLDGYSRKLLALVAFRGSASTRDLLRIIRTAVRETGTAPRFLITDHGPQFKKVCRAAARSLGTTPVHSRVGGWQLNAKIERQFRTMKHWRRRAVLPLGRRALQRRLDAYRHWYNDLRPHAAHDALTPAEASVKMTLPKPVVYRRQGKVEPVISVRRRRVRGDPYLFVPEIDCPTKRQDAA